MAIVTLALGVGATTAVFSFVDALLFRAAAGVGEGTTLVNVYTSDFSSGPYGEHVVSRFRIDSSRDGRVRAAGGGGQLDDRAVAGR